MKPVDQTTFGFPGGNCFSACVASILELSIEEVPYFMGDMSDNHDWLERFAEWLAPRGLYPVHSMMGDGPDGWAPRGLHVMSGQSPRHPDGPERLHSVVARGREMLHDPHPLKRGLLSIRDTVILVPFDPSR